jgi:hypothetical protein
MGAPSKQLSDGVEGAEHTRRTSRRSRSTSTDSITLSPSGAVLRSSGNHSRSPGEVRHRSDATRSDKNEHAKGVSRSRSNSDDKQRLVSSTKSSRPSSKDRKSYLSQRASEKKESKGRKSSVLGSLTTFLDEQNNMPRTTGRSRDAQSVISSASSRRRRRSCTPSSASVVGGLSMTREELCNQRRSRSSSGGPLDRMMQEQKQSRSNRERSTSGTDKARDSSSRRRETSGEPTLDSRSRRESGRRSADSSKPTGSSKRRDSTRTRTRSVSVSARTEQLSPSVTRTPTKSRSADSVILHPTESPKAGARSPGSVAEVPPGFPMAAVDSNASSKRERGSNAAGLSSTLDSTARLRERQAGLVANSFGGENTRRRRRSILGNNVTEVEKSEEEKHRSPAAENKRGALKASKSESAKNGLVQGRVSRRQSMEMGSDFTAQRKKSISDSDINTDRVSKSAKDVIQTGNNAGESKRLERQKSNRRTQSPGPLTAKSPTHARDSSLDVEERRENDLNRNLLLVNEKKSSSKSSKRKGSSQSIASAPAVAGRKSISMDRRRLKRTTSRLAEASSENKPRAIPCVNEENESISDNQLERFNSSTDSLDVDLLTNSPSIHNKITNADQLFGDDGKNKATVEEQDILSQSSSNSDTMKSEGDQTRLSWVELPLFDPQQLLVKSADCDGANEISELSSHVQSVDLLGDPVAILSKMITDDERKEMEKKKKSNPSLQEAIDKDKAERTANGAQDEKTIVTTTTSTSDATLKTTNRDPASKKPAWKKAKVDDLEASQDSMAIDQLEPVEGGRQGSSGSLSRSSKRSKESSKRSKSSLDSKDASSESSKSLEKSKSRRSTRSSSGSLERNKDKSQDGSSRSKLQRRPSERKGKSLIRSESKTSEEMTGETTLDGEGSNILKKKPSLESPGTINRKKSYLNKRKIVKADKNESKEAKKAVNTSLDAFLKRIEGAAPVVKDDNRSVYSSMQERERRRRSLLQTGKDGRKSRRISRSNPRRSLESALDGLDGDGKDEDDADIMSITSAPMLRARSRSSLVKELKKGSPQMDASRPVVDLKNTQFSNKLSKLHVAF